MSRAFVLVVLAGCAFDRGGLTAEGVVPDADPNAPDADPNAPDADPTAPDAEPGAPDADPDVCITWNAQNVADPCDPALGTPGTITLAAGRNRYDTDTGVLTAPSNATSTPPSVLISQPSGSQARALVLTGLSIPVGTALVATGSRPLIIIIHGDATIDGTIDVSATVDNLDVSTPGAGGDADDDCSAGAGEAGEDSTGAGGAGGGGGGGYGANGGDGTDGNGGGHGNKGGKGSTEDTSTIVPLRGGCPGGRGGDTLAAISPDGGRGGSGGGAVELTARGAITVNGTIAANATGGAAPGLVNAGGGGAGSGGAILLDAEVLKIDATAKLCANGGGGGEGGQTISASEDGEDATCVEAPRAEGGEINADGGNGGDGGALATPTGTNAAGAGNGGGGGGGGGSVGRIRVIGRGSLDLDVGSIVSPDPP